MCKVLAIPGIKPELGEKAFNFVFAAKQIMSQRDNDGFGYAAITDKGEIVSEKWLLNDDAFIQREEYSPREVEVLKSLGYDTPSGKVYSAVGAPTSKVISIIAHARMATCQVCIENTHPFIDQNTALVHNGVISNHARWEKKLSSCDSEALLTNYIEKEIVNKPGNMTEFATPISGSYACAVLAKNNEEQWIMDIFRNASSFLVCTYVHQLDTVVIATNEEILKGACKAVGFNHGTVLTIKPGTLIRFGAKSGKVLETLKFKGWEYASTYNNYYTGGHGRDAWDNEHGTYCQRGGGRKGDKKKSGKGKGNGIGEQDGPASGTDTKVTVPMVINGKPVTDEEVKDPYYAGEA